VPDENEFPLAGGTSGPADVPGGPAGQLAAGDVTPATVPDRQPAGRGARGPHRPGRRRPARTWWSGAWAPRWSRRRPRTRAKVPVADPRTSSPPPA